MNEEPEIPQPPPVIPRRRLWLTVAIPPLASLLAILIIPFCGFEPNDMAGYLLLVPLLVSSGLILGLAFHFLDAVAHRYRGPSLGFLVFSYVLGQIIVCVVLAVGSCVLVLFNLPPS